MATNHDDEYFIYYPRPEGWYFLSDSEQRAIEAEEEHEANG
tara:strand:+ start:574 stop:696 length:123 start_codon:yes stop_codon:yes gene_type:complete